jgi:hypothetical protein
MESGTLLVDESFKWYANLESSTKTVELYIPLLNEGTDVLRPTKGLRLEADVCRVLPTADYNPAVEEWAFPPGTKVRCVTETRSDGKLLVARQRITE